MNMEAPDRPLLGQLLLQAGKISARDLERALLAQAQMGDLIGRVLVKLGLVSELDVATALSRQLEVPLIHGDALKERAVLDERIRSEFLRANRVIPLGEQDGVLDVVMASPNDDYLLKALALATGDSVKACVGPESEIDAVLDTLLEPEDAIEDADNFALARDDEFLEHLRDLATEAPVIRLVSDLFVKAIDLGASDVHLEPLEAEVQARFRVDGVLVDGGVHIGPELLAAVVSRIKLLARLNIAERRLPQDGRIRTRVKGHELDLRVSTIPTVHGESVVMRVLDRSSTRLDLDGMGFHPENLDRFQALLGRPHGILLVTGPTGSGKTTTLYASLGQIDIERLKVLTVEDPVEYQLEGINQIQVHPEIELTFARALRAILRQDPDVVMVGEMRDSETAQIAVQAALTGHLVLSTLHTNTAAGAIVRLEDMGVERYLITSSVIGVLAQRLVRRLCPDCKVPLEVTEAHASDLPAIRGFLQPGDRIYRQGAGCPRCKQTGYSGRMAIHELLEISGPLHQAVIEGQDARSLHELAKREGMKSLFEDGLRKVASGDTSLDEILRVTRERDQDE
ncbi:MAG: GspE/PulE family protein [Halothiobacillaceae bacterium]